MFRPSSLSLACLGCLLLTSWQAAQAVHPDPLPITNSEARSEAEMKPYTDLVEHSEGKLEMVPIKGGKFLMGSPASEKGRKPDEGPQHEVEISPFWMSKFEVTWDVYEVWMADIDITRREITMIAPNARDKLADMFQISQPTKPYTDMTFGMGKKGFPAICMTQHACRVFCKWLSAKTGRYYRLPTEAEWEYACRAGTTTAYSFGDKPDSLEDFAWFTDNSGEKYQPVGKKRPNPWGLHDMHGNVMEWVLDQHTDDYSKAEKGAKDPLVVPLTEYNRSVRGGSWNDKPENCRSASRVASHEDWKQQDPQIPQSIWYFTDALNLGFRVVRPLTEPSDEEKAVKWDKSEPPQIDKDKTEK